MSQSAYTDDLPVAIEGMLADSSQTKDVLSLNNKDTLVFIGKFVAKGTLDNEIIHPAAATDITDVKKARGVVLHSHANESIAGSAAPSYAIQRSVPVLAKGRMWVVFEDAPSVLVQPSVRFAGVGQAGAFRNTPVGGETALLPDAKVLAVAAGNFALIQIDL